MKRAWERENKKIRRSKSSICLKEVQDLENACDVGVNPRGSAWKSNRAVRRSQKQDANKNSGNRLLKRAWERKNVKKKGLKARICLKKVQDRKRL